MTDDIFSQPDTPTPTLAPTPPAPPSPPTAPAYTPPQPSVVVAPQPAVRKASKLPWLVAALAALVAVAGSVMYVGQKSATDEAKAATAKVEAQLATANDKVDAISKKEAATKEELSYAREDISVLTLERDALVDDAADADALRACITQMDDADYTTTENFLDFMKMLSDPNTTEEGIKAQATTIKDSINAFADLAESCKAL